MTCLQEQSALELLEGQLSPGVRAERRRHIEECEPCRALVGAVAAVVSLSWSTRPQRPVREFVRAGDIVGRYRIERSIASGAMGRVFEAWDPELRRRVAIKFLHVGAADWVQREARALAALSHPNVVEVLELGQSRHGRYIVMEYISGETLATWSKRSHRWSQVLEVFLGAARGLEAAHERGLVHRDFKPQNVLIGDDGRVKVADFGLARQDESVGDGFSRTSPLATDHTSTTGMVGTPAYMAHEVLAGGRASAASDQFSFCVGLHEALLGHRPFQAPTLGGLRRAIERGPMSDSSFRTISPAVMKVVRRGLEHDPGRRYPSMQALESALRAARTRSSTRRRQTLAMVGAAALAASVGSAFVMRERDEAAVSSDMAGPSPVEERFDRRFQTILDLADGSERREQLQRLRRGAARFEQREIQARAALQLGLDSVERNDRDAAEAEFQEAFYLAAEAEVPDVARDAAGALAISIYLYQHRPVAARQWFRHARAFLDQAPDPKMRVDLARGESSLALHSGDVHEAERLLRTEIDDPLVDDASRALLEVTLAETLVLTGRSKAAEVIIRGVPGLETLEPEEHSRALNTLGLALIGMHDYDEAVRVLEDAIELEDDPLQATAAQASLSIAYFASHRTDEALELLQGVRDTLAEGKGSDHPDVATIDLNLAMRYFDLGKHRRAVEAGERALDSMKSVGVQPPNGEFHLHRVIAESRLALGELEQAEFAFERLLERTRARDDATGSRQMGYALAGLGLVAAARGEHRTALDHYERATALYIDHIETTLEAAARMRIAHADSLWAAGKREEATRLVATARASLVASREHSREQNVAELGRWLDEHR